MENRPLFYQQAVIIFILVSILGIALGHHAPMKGVGLYHTAILYATRKELAKIDHRIRMAKYPMTGASDKGV